MIIIKPALLNQVGILEGADVPDIPTQMGKETRHAGAFTTARRDNHDW